MDIGLNANNSQNQVVNILRLLTQPQNDISASDMTKFWWFYRGSVEGAEFMLSQGLIQSDSDLPHGETPFPPLATALGNYGLGLSEWEYLIRLLLRQKVDLHSPVPRFGTKASWFGLGYPCAILEDGTPLDELFGSAQTPLEGMVAADCWLEILSSEGYDVKAYLEEEQALHAAQMQFTYSSWGR